MVTADVRPLHGARDRATSDISGLTMNRATP